MKTSTALMALVVCLGVPAASHAQLSRLFQRPSQPSLRPVNSPKPAPDPVPTPANPPAADPSAPADKGVNPANVIVPMAVNPNDLPPPTVPMPTEPIEPYLLTTGAGPFMVHAHTFKGPYAERSAQLLAMELRQKNHLPAYVFRPKDFPMRSLIRGVPPNANPGVNRPLLALPELERVKDEAAVLVGDMKTIDDAQKLAHEVRKLKPACLDGLPDWHTKNHKFNGLRRAIQTTNPYAPAETLFPDKPDAMIAKINQGPHSLYTCPGKYSLQVAEFYGRSEILQGDAATKKFGNLLDLRKSPLASAADDAERLAANLARDPSVRQTGYVPYVYHDRFSSKVYLGAFNSPTDPEAVKLRTSMLKMSNDLFSRRVSTNPIAPASALTDIAPLKR